MPAHRSCSRTNSPGQSTTMPSGTPPSKTSLPLRSALTWSTDSEGNPRFRLPVAHKPLIRITFRTRVALWAGTMTLLCVSIMAMVAWVISEKLLSSELSTRLSTIADVRKGQITDYVRSVFVVAELIATRVLVQRYILREAHGLNITSEDTKTANDDLSSATQSYGTLVMAKFVTPTGKSLLRTWRASFPDQPLAYTFDDRDGLGNKVSNVFPLGVEGDYGLAFEISIQAGNAINQTIAKFQMVLSTDDLETIINDTTGLQESGQLVLVKLSSDRQSFNFVLPPVRSPVSVTESFRVSAYGCLSTALLHPAITVAESTSFRGDRVKCAFRPTSDDETSLLIAEISAAEFYTPINTMQTSLLIGIASTFAFSLITAVIFAGYTVRPIRGLRKVAAEYSKGNFQKLPPQLTIRRIGDEIADLSQTFNEMAIQISAQTLTLERKVQDRTKDLEVAKREADQANAAKSSFLAAISHEVRTPLNGILGLLSLLEDSHLDEKQKDMVASIRECSDGLLLIVNDVLDFSKIEAGKMQVESRIMDLYQCVKTSLYLFTTKATQKGLRLEYHIADDVPRYIMGDALRLQQILNNLFSNAIKFTSVGTVDISIATLTSRADSSSCGAHVNSDADGSSLPNCIVQVDLPGEIQPTVRRPMLLFSVQDSGVGIPEEAIGKLFRSFTQVDASITRKYGGTGLGLSICKLLVELMGGNIYVSSTAGKGSSFSFTLPLEAPPANLLESWDHLHTSSTDVVGPVPPTVSAIAGQLNRRRSADNGHTVRILLAEDNVINVKVATAMLAKLQYTDFSVVGNGEEAVRTVKERNALIGYVSSEPKRDDNIHIVLMDMQMPVMSGIMATMQIREDTSLKQPIIIGLTANAMESDRQKCLVAGMDDFLTKPINFAMLAQTLEKFAKEIAEPQTRS